MKVPQAWQKAVEARTGVKQVAAVAKPAVASIEAASRPLRVPQAVLATKPEAKKVLARIDMSAEVAGAGLCPECKTQMQRCVANGIETYACHPDRIVIPVPDAVAQGEAAVQGDEELDLEATFGPSTAQSPFPQTY